jgi:hypothetical protein
MHLNTNLNNYAYENVVDEDHVGDRFSGIFQFPRNEGSNSSQW